MPVKDNREYRSFQLMPQDGGGSCGYIVEGYATTFDEPYDLGYGGMSEVIRSTALAGADMSDVIFQLNHEGTVMARMRNGSLSVDNDAHGMRVRADLGGSEAGRSLYESIKNGLIDRMSWGFTVADGGWEYDEATRTSIITKVDKVFDVSAVSIPANENTVIQARSYLHGVIEAEQLRESQQREQEHERDEALRVLGLTYL